MNRSWLMTDQSNTKSLLIISLLYWLKGSPSTSTMTWWSLHILMENPAVIKTLAAKRLDIQKAFLGWRFSQTEMSNRLHLPVITLQSRLQELIMTGWCHQSCKSIWDKPRSCYNQTDAVHPSSVASCTSTTQDLVLRMIHCNRSWMSRDIVRL